ncbi:MAG: YIP1 family protein [Candidatus Symbiothrix sp.]|nr:YIP1 family protein [Candidatus Symbiothrix sp.]
MDDTQMMYLQSVSFQKPSTIFLIAILLGWERFFLDDIVLGIIKVITGYGCGIWWLIDIFSAKKRAQKYNFEQFQKATVFVGGNTNTPIVSLTDTTVNSSTVAENITANAETQSSQYVAAPANNENFETFKAKATEISQNPVVARVKNILFSPKTEWKTIDNENKLQGKVLTNYLLLLAAVPAIVSLLGYFFYGVFGDLPFGMAFGMGFKVAIMMYAVIVGGTFLTALVANLLADKFGSVKDFNKAFSMAAYAWTPMCVAGILLIYPTLFLFWAWVIIGVLYGIFLIYSGIQPLLKTPLEQLTPYVAICAGGFAAAFFLLLIVLSYVFLGELYFSILSYLSY